jgi:two-component system response regulator AlgR
MADTRVLVVDDEPLARARLCRMLDQIAGFAVCGEAANGTEALRLAAEQEPDLLLLDIRMPAPDGVQVAARLNQNSRGRPPAIIFCTAYDEYALPAFDAAAVDYLLKPIKQARLEQALSRATGLSRAQLSQLADLSPAEDGEQFTVRSHKGLFLVPVADIRCFIAEDKYVTMMHGGGEEIIDNTLRALEQQYADRFLRVHRRALVARRYIAALEKGGSGQYFVRLKGTDFRPEVSRRQLPELRRLLSGHT